MFEWTELFLSIAICFCVGSVSTCAVKTNAANNQAINELVAKGADPIAAGCVVRVSKDNAICIANVIKKESK